jgi:ABC-type antimicrobial peptide transport system permease subunit
VTFALFSQTAEYAISARETAKAAAQYSGTGTAEVLPVPDQYVGSANYIDTDPRVVAAYPETEQHGFRYLPLTQAQLDEISALPYISSTDTRYMTAGFSADYTRPDDGGYFYNYTARVIVEGTLEEVKIGGDPAIIGTTADGEMFNYNLLTLNDCKIIAEGGGGSWRDSYETIKISSDPRRNIEYREGVGGGLERRTATYTSDYIYDTEYVEGLICGQRYVFVARYEPLYSAPGDDERQKYPLILSDHLSAGWCKSIWNVDGAPDYLSDVKFAPLRELAEITSSDKHTFDVVYTGDMSTISRFADGKAVITDGRALTPEDSASGEAVCVISREEAEASGLAVGSTITLTLGTELFEQYKGLGALAGYRARYFPGGTEVALTIIGIYADTDGAISQVKSPNFSYSLSTIFVPASLLSVDAQALSEHEFSPAEFSFKVDNAYDIPAFLAEAAPKFEEMGLTLIFSDGGWSGIMEAFLTAKKLSLIRIAILGAATAAATGFVVFLFIAQKKKEYAVMRALGTARRQSAKALLLPLSVLLVASVLIGSGAAWIYTVKTVARSSAVSALGGAVSTSVPAPAVLGCIFGELLLAFIIALILLQNLGARSPLALLQGGAGRRARNKKVKKSANIFSTAPPETIRVGGISALVAFAPTQKHGSFGFSLRYIVRHARRSPGKSVLAGLLAALLLATVGQVALMKQTYTDLCKATVVKASFVGGIQLSAVPQLKGLGYVTDPYYEAQAQVGLNFSSSKVVITNDIARYTDEDAVITYADGYDETCMDTLGNILIFGQMALQIHGLSPGDTVEVITPPEFIPNIQDFIASFKAENPEETLSDLDTLVKYRDYITQNTGTKIYTFTVAGVVTTPSGKYDTSVFAPGSNEQYGALGKTAVRLSVAEFTLADFTLANELLEYGENMAKWGGGSSPVDFYMDMSKLEGLLKTLRLLEALYPIVIAAAAAIGGFLCALVIFQSAKSASIMRIQGTTKRKTRLILSFEQVLLAVIGLILGIAGLLVYNGAALSAVLPQLALFAALYFAVIVIAAAVSSVIITRRSVLELLQTKE